MKVITLEERGRQIQALLDAGTRIPSREEMMNNGRRRTQGKREVLAALERIRRDNGYAIGFEAKS